MKFFIFIFTLMLFACGKFLHNTELEDNDASVDITIENTNDANIESDVLDSSIDTTLKTKFVFEKSNKSISFFDDFERPDNSSIGNGWIEKTDVFSIINGGVTLDTQGGPVDRIVRRTSGLLDTEISGRITIISPYNEISLFSRMQPDELGNLVGYRVWFAITKMQIELRIKTGNGTALYELGQIPIYPSLNVGSSYDFHMRTTGSDLVNIEAGIFDVDGKMIQSIQGKDVSAYRILTPGLIGFGQREANGNRWESFSMVELP